MIILIGGVGCTGKTAMAQKLLEKYKMPYLSVDHLKMGLYRGTADCQFTPEDDSVVIGEHLWPILRAVIMTNIENRQNLIIEGCYLLPNKVTGFDEEYIKHIISFYIGFSADYIRRYYEYGIIKHCGVIEARGSDAVASIEQLVSEHVEQKSLCRANGAKYFEINSVYSEEMKIVYEWLDAEMKKRSWNI